MMRTSLVLTGLTLTLLAGCDGSDGAVVAAPKPETGQAAAKPEEKPSVPATRAELPAVEGAPDRTKDPVGFLLWRVDQMFLRADVNVDGFLELHEYEGPLGSEAERLAAFKRIDANGDGKLTQEEVVDGMVASNPELQGAGAPGSGQSAELKR